jgi:hypothetical protein
VAENQACTISVQYRVKRGITTRNSYSYSFQNSESADVKALLPIHIKDFPKSSRAVTRGHMSLEFSADEVVGLGYTKQIITLTKTFYLMLSNTVEVPRGVAPGRGRRAGKMQVAGRESRGWLVEAEYPTLPRCVGEDNLLR